MEFRVRAAVLVFAVLVGCSAAHRDSVLDDPTLGGFVQRGSVSVLWIKEGRSQTMEKYAGQHYGRALSAIGDLNEDGVSDFISSAEVSAAHGPFRSGSRISALSGRDGSELWTHRSYGDQTLVEVSTRGVGDVDGDGVEDVVATVQAMHGVVSVFALSGRDGRALESDGAGEELVGVLDRKDGSMQEIAIPDFDGDGHADRLLGELIDVGEVGGNRGRATIISGASRAVLRCDEPRYEPVQLPGGIDLRWVDLRLLAGDVDGDCRTDAILVVTCSFSPSTITVFSGIDGRILLYASTATASPLARWTGPVIAPGDLDGDGRDDLVLGMDLPGAVSSVVAVRVD